MHYRGIHIGLPTARLAMAVAMFCALASSVYGFAAALSTGQEKDLSRLLKAVEERYNRPKTLRLRFQQLYRQSGQTLRDETGTLYLMKPGQMRWEYENPEPKIFLSDGKRVLFYLPAEKRMTEALVKNSDDLRNPIRFLLGGLKFEKEFERIGKSGDVAPLEPGNTVIRGVPKAMKDRLESVTMEIAPDNFIRRLILAEPGGTSTDFRFSGEAPDTRLPPELFKFTPPQGTQIVKE